MGRKEYEMAFSLNAKLGNGYAATFTKAQKEIASMQKEIVSLSRAQADIAAYQKQQGAIEATRKKMEVLQQQYDNIQKEISETEGFSSSLSNRLLSKQQQIDKTSASLGNQSTKLDQMSAALRSAGIKTDDLGSASTKLGAKLAEVKKEQEKAAEGAGDFGASTARAFNVVQEAIAAAGIAVAMRETFEYFQECAAASMEFESAITGVAKTTNLTDEELSTMSRQLIEMSTSIPATTTELAAVAEAAGQLGIAKGDLLSFTETMTMLGTATNLSADEAASQLAKFANITRMSANDYGRLGATVVALGNNFATTEADIVNMGMNLAAAGEMAEISEANIMGLATVMSSLGVEAQMGGTAISKLLRDFETMIATGSSELEDYAQVAGMSAAEFSQAWGQNAVSATAAFIQGLGKMEASGGSAIATLDELGITESRQVDALSRLASSGDLLVKAIDLSNASWAENSALSAEAEKRYATTESKLIMLQNSYNNLQSAIGDAYTPVLREAFDAGNEVLKGLELFVSENPEVVRAVTATVGVLGAATTAVLGLSAAAKALQVLKIGTMLASPFGWALGAVTAVGMLTAGIAAYNAEANAAENEIRSLTAVSREQYDSIQELTAEYEVAVQKYGAMSAEAGALKNEVDTLNASFEVGKQTLDEFKAETDALAAAQATMREEYNASIKSIEAEAGGTLALIKQLETLGQKTNMETGDQEAMKAIIDELNASVPGLALNYDDVANSLDTVIAKTEEMARAQAMEEVNAEKYKQMVELIKDQADLEAQLAVAAKEYETDRDELIGVLKAKDWAYNEEALAFHGQNTDMEKSAADYNRIGDLIRANKDDVALLKAEMGEYAQEIAAVAEQTGAATLTAEQTEKLKELTIAYDEAREAARQSIQGQYEMWDKASKAVPTDISDIKAAMATQIQSRQEYLANMQKLYRRSANIPGLENILKQFSDGSAESVNMIAGLTKAGDSGLSSLIRQYNELAGAEESLINFDPVVMESYAELNAAAGDAASAQGEYNAALADTHSLQSDTYVGAMELDEEMNNAKATLEELAVAYSEAYESALSSIQGQYAAWEEAEKITGKNDIDASALNKGAESQMAYLDAASANVSALIERAEDIEGLQEYMATVAANYSPEEIAKLYAGMAASSDEELQKVIENDKELREKQAEYAEMLAQLETDFGGTTDRLQKELEDAIEEMNLGSEAAIAAQSTIEGFIQAANDPVLLGRVKTAYADVAAAAADALWTNRSGADGGTTGQSGSTGSYRPIDGSHAGGLDYVPYDGYIAELHKGERVLTSEDAQLVTYAPELVAALSAVGAQSNPLMAAGGGYGGVNVQLSPQYNISGVENTEQLGAILTENNENLRALVSEVINDHVLDAARRRY